MADDSSLDTFQYLQCNNNNDDDDDDDKLRDSRNDTQDGRRGGCRPIRRSKFPEVVVVFPPTTIRIANNHQLNRVN